MEDIPKDVCFHGYFPQMQIYIVIIVSKKARYFEIQCRTSGRILSSMSKAYFIFVFSNMCVIIRFIVILINIITITLFICAYVYD